MTQASVSRDIRELGLVKLAGRVRACRDERWPRRPTARARNRRSA